MMRAAVATTLFSLMIAAPGAGWAAETTPMPADGSKVSCVVSVLMPGSLLVQCHDLFAGTVMSVPAGGYWGMLVCQEKKGTRGCPEVIPTTLKFDGVKFAENQLNGASVNCTVKGNAKAYEDVSFICAQ
jgi:hypothetical protein